MMKKILFLCFILLGMFLFPTQAQTPLNITADNPYIENFDSYTNGISTNVNPHPDYPDIDMPTGWTFLNRSDDKSIMPIAFLTIDNLFFHPDSVCLDLKSSDSIPLYAVLPAFTNDIENLILSFTYRHESINQFKPKLALGLMTDLADTSTYTELFQYHLTLDWTDTVFDFSTSGQTGQKFIVFRYFNGKPYSDGFKVGIDNVEVRLATSGPLPTELDTVVCDKMIWEGDTLTESGDYEHTYTDAVGNDSTVTLHLTVWPLPEVVITADLDSVQIGASAILTASGAETYEWSTGETTPQITVAPETTTTYSVEGTDVHGCANTASIIISVYGVGIETYDGGILVYPNPATLSVNVMGRGMKSVSLYGPAGQLLTAIRAGDSPSVTLPMEDYAAGHYILQIRLRNGRTVHKKIILQR